MNIINNNYKMTKKGYIYVRTHESYDKFNAYKLGKTDNIPNRDSNYTTSEIVKGKFIVVIEVDYDLLDDIESKLKNYFKLLEYHIYHNGGTEFFKKDIQNKIIPFLNSNQINYKLLTDNEINNLIRKSKKHILDENIIKPREDQEIIINNLFSYLQKNDKALLILMCGIGKTLISLWTVEKLKFLKIIIGVPNTLLLKQWYSEISRIMNDINILLVKSGVSDNDIKKFINENEKHIIITTYASSYKVVKATKEINHIFDIKINDECHHLTSKNMEKEKTTKTYVEMMKINSIKQISLTATIKNLESNSSDLTIISNDDIEYFGNVIDKRCLLWAINNKIVCDYLIQTIITNNYDINNLFTKFKIINVNDKRLFLSAYSSLKSIKDGNSHHLLIYANSKENSSKIINYINQLIEVKYFTINELNYNYYHSDMKSKEQKDILKKYNKSKYGIISCVYCLGEGYDNKIIDGVVFAENMSSNIRIVQSALRAGRKNKNEPTKLTKIILPILNTNDLLSNDENIDLKKVREIIYQMGLEDETIMSKVKVFKIDIENKPNNKEQEKNNNKIEFGIYDDELTKKLRLKSIPRYALDISYEKAKLINKQKLKIKSKKAYLDLCEVDIRLPKNPEERFKGTFDWIDYLNIERIYYDLDTCIEKVNYYLFENQDIKKDYLNLSIVCDKLCQLDNNFPPNGLWTDYYKVKNINEIIKISLKKKSKGLIL
jgi:superfamily II DNA or RNA helicase